MKRSSYISNKLLENKTLTTKEKALVVYLIMKKSENKCFPNITEIRKYLKASLEKTISTIEKLIERKYLKIKFDIKN